MKNLQTFNEFVNESSINEAAIEIVYYSEVVDNWGRTESSSKPDVIAKLLQSPDDWSDDQTFEDKLGKPYDIDTLIGKTVKVGNKTFKVEESVINEAASVPSNILEFAKRKGSYATALVKKAATWAEKAGKHISGGTAIGKNYSTIILDMKYQGSEIYINLDRETIELHGEEVNDAKSFQKVLDANK